MGDSLLAELAQCDVDTEHTFRADAASPRTLILLDDTGERTIIAVDSGEDMVAALRAGAAWGAATVAQLRSIPVPWEELAGPFHYYRRRDHG